MQLSVCSIITCLELSIFILAQVCLRSLRYLSGLSHLSFSALIAYFVGQTKPKILRLISSVRQNYPPACVTL